MIRSIRCGRHSSKSTPSTPRWQVGHFVSKSENSTRDRDGAVRNAEMGQIVRRGPQSCSLWGIKWHKQMFKSRTSQFVSTKSPVLCYFLHLRFQTMRSHRLVVDEIVRSSLLHSTCLRLPNVYVWGRRFSHWSMELESTRRPSGTFHELIESLWWL